MKHHVGTVADHGINFFVRFSHFYAECGIYFITHAGETVFNMVRMRIVYAPASLQVARHGAGCTYNDTAVFSNELVDNTESAALSQNGTGDVFKFFKYFIRIERIVDFRNEVFACVFNVIETVSFCYVFSFNCSQFFFCISGFPACFSSSASIASSATFASATT